MRLFNCNVILRKGFLALTLVATVTAILAGCAHNRDKNVYTKTTTYNIINATRINIQTINYQQPEIRKVKSNDSTFTYENGILKSIKTKNLGTLFLRKRKNPRQRLQISRYFER